MISLIVAIANNNVIGRDNELPWHYKKDLEYFKKITTNHTVVMGRNTFFSIIKKNGKILPNRTNVVVSRNQNFSYPNVLVVNDLSMYLSKHHDEEIFIIGGSEVYRHSLAYADRLYITRINQDFIGDIYFPDYKEEDFKLISSAVDGELKFLVYERKSK